MAIVTVSRQYGCGGAEIGRAVATVLGAEYVDSELIAEAARRIGVPQDLISERDERIRSVTERLLEDIRLAFTGLRRPGLPVTAGPVPPLTDAQLLAVTRSLIAEAARGNNAVIVGRGAQVLLRRHKSALHVHLVAPLAHRVEKIVARRGVSAEEAKSLIAKTDADRAAYLRTNYQADWEDPLLYHFVLNTGMMSCEAAVHLLVVAASGVDEARRAARAAGRGGRAAEAEDVLASVRAVRESIRGIVERYRTAP